MTRRVCAGMYIRKLTNIGRTRILKEKGNTEGNGERYPYDYVRTLVRRERNQVYLFLSASLRARRD
jgi:hypothetical protein